MPQKRAVIDGTKCAKCQSCQIQAVCPAKAIEREDSSDPYFVNTGCQGCGQCLNQCPHRAVQLV